MPIFYMVDRLGPPDDRLSEKRFQQLGHCVDTVCTISHDHRTSQMSHYATPSGPQPRKWEFESSVGSSRGETPVVSQPHRSSSSQPHRGSALPNPRGSSVEANSRRGDQGSHGGPMRAAMLAVEVIDDHAHHVIAARGGAVV